MKTKYVPGEFAFKALINGDKGWQLTNHYFFTQKEVTEIYLGSQIIWPVEVLDNQTVYVPAEEELE